MFSSKTATQCPKYNDSTCYRWLTRYLLTAKNIRKPPNTSRRYFIAHKKGAFMQRKAINASRVVGSILFLGTCR